MKVSYQDLMALHGFVPVDPNSAEAAQMHSEREALFAVPPVLGSTTVERLSKENFPQFMGWDGWLVGGKLHILKPPGGEGNGGRNSMWHAFIGTPRYDESLSSRAYGDTAQQALDRLLDMLGHTVKYQRADLQKTEEALAACGFLSENAEEEDTPLDKVFPSRKGSWVIDKIFKVSGPWKVQHVKNADHTDRWLVYCSLAGELGFASGSNLKIVCNSAIRHLLSALSNKLVSVRALDEKLTEQQAELRAALAEFTAAKELCETMQLTGDVPFDNRRDAQAEKPA